MFPLIQYFALVASLLFLGYVGAYESPPQETLLARYPWYHTTSMIRDDLQKIAADSPFVTVRSEPLEGTNHAIDIVTIRKGSPKHRFFVLAGEHARELVSPESALNFVKALSGQIDETKEMANNVLKHTEFQIVVNGNPVSRTKVEKGDYCLRVNENGVDLNRNWGDHWEKESINGRDTYPGSHPFSEPEARIFQAAIKEYNPHTFLSVHSGTLGMYMPFAYSSRLPLRNEHNMLSLLKRVDSMYCKCPFGPAGAEVGYKSYGTCLDYVYEKFRVPFAYAFEIYANKERQEILHTAWQQAVKSANEESLTSVKSPLESDFLDIKNRKYKNMRSADTVLASDLDCFEQFNPSTKEEYESTLNNWTKAYLTVAEETAKKLK